MNYLNGPTAFSTKLGSGSRGLSTYSTLSKLKDNLIHRKNLYHTEHRWWLTMVRLLACSNRPSLLCLVLEFARKVKIYIHSDHNSYSRKTTQSVKTLFNVWTGLKTVVQRRCQKNLSILPLFQNRLVWTGPKRNCHDNNYNNRKKWLGGGGLRKN